MKNFVCKTFLAIIILVLPTMLYAQSNEQRIIGTWTDQSNNTWVFNSNGSFSIRGGSNDSGVYRVIGSKIALGQQGEQYALVFDITISTDARTIILSGGPMGIGYFLTRNN